MTLSLPVPPYMYLIPGGGVTLEARAYRARVAALVGKERRLPGGVSIRVATTATERYHQPLLAAVGDALVFSGLVKRVEMGVVDQVERTSVRGFLDVTVSVML